MRGIARLRGERGRCREGRRSGRGLTLLEVMVAIGVLAMVSVLIYGAFDGLSRGKKSLARVDDRYHEGRLAMGRIASEISSAFLSQHQPLVVQQATRQTIFVSTNGSPADRLDFTSFSHRRLMRDAHESDQNEISYFGSQDRDVPGKTDLVRRESPTIDIEPRKGGEINLLAEDIDLFDVKFLEPLTGQWLDTWDSSQAATGQPNRLPMQVKVILVLNHVLGNRSEKFVTKIAMPMQSALSFAVPR